MPERRTLIVAAGQSSSRIDFAPPMCVLPHSITDAGGPTSRFWEADAVPTPRKAKLWESLRVRLQSSRADRAEWRWRSEEHRSELKSLMRISYAVYCLKKKTN